MRKDRKHSPGPWHVDRAHVRSTQDDLLAIYSNNGDKLAVLTDDPSLEWRANAQLMAAAPELLAECERALALLAQYEDLLAESTYYKSSALISRLKSVTEKAKGLTEK
jgi:hypothetical protein